MNTTGLINQETKILDISKYIADIASITSDLPSWKHRSVQPLILDDESVSRMILDKSNQGLERA